MRRRSPVIATVMCAAVVLCMSQSALGLSTVLLSFGSTYRSPDGSTCVHQGIDIAAQPGAGVGSLTAGEVTFAGKVPGDAGGQVYAVTVRSAEGTLVTMHPLASVAVTRGAQVSCGESLGELAREGDSSSAAAHVHVSARHNSVYVDPAFLLQASDTTEQQPDASGDAPSRSTQRTAAPPAPAGSVPCVDTLPHSTGVSVPNASSEAADVGSSVLSGRAVSRKPASSSHTHVLPSAVYDNAHATRAAASSRVAPSGVAGWEPGFGNHSALAGLLGFVSAGIANARWLAAALAAGLAIVMLAMRQRLLGNTNAAR